jgi:hypothetical protein
MVSGSLKAKLVPEKKNAAADSLRDGEPLLFSEIRNDLRLAPANVSHPFGCGFSTTLLSVVNRLV